MDREQNLRKTLKGESGPATYQKNYLIEAGAGAGKTDTMVHRIASQLIGGWCKPENMAVITFTNKATEEMRGRLDGILRRKRDEEQDAAKKQKINDLIRAVGRMQISTIHSFCKTMLESLPFESGLGMEMTYIDDENGLAREFFVRKYREDHSRFARIEALGIQVRDLADAFASLCGMKDGEIRFVAENSPSMKDHLPAICTQMKDLHRKLPPAVKGCEQAQKLLDEKVAELLSKSEAEFVSDSQNALQLAVMVSFRDNPLKKYKSDEFLQSVKPKKGSADSALKAQWKCISDLWEASQKCVSVLTKELIHSRCMPIMLELEREFEEEKRRKRIVSSNDLLVFTRDMLRDSKEARRVLHDRYRVLYVDEFQDTDPVQAQILFYLTAEGAFDLDWRKCKPADGSLFLVGDPKQAIYRFRGADIDVYKKVEEIFRSGIGEVEHLKLNFRSTEEICTLTQKVFEPDQSSKIPGEMDAVTERLDGGFYQALFSPMESNKGKCSLARTAWYPSGEGKADERKGEDARRVAAFIRAMVRDGVPVGNDSHPAAYSDFLILPPAKASVDYYAAELIEAGIPVNATGKRIYQEIEPIQKLLMHLESLNEPRSDFALGKVLILCYGIKLPAIRRFLQQAYADESKYSVSGALNDDRLEKLGAAFSNAEKKDEDVLALCAALKEILELREFMQVNPAVSVAEKLADGGYGIWGVCKDITQRKRDYSYMQQFLQLLRRSPERGFSALVEFARECGKKVVEHELALEEDANAVRVMNLHKAKGLEGEIVILPYANDSSDTLTAHMKRGANGVEHFACIYERKNEKSKPSVRGQPMLWETAPTGGISLQAREKKYLDAEVIRLLYVAATRAKSMLLVCGDPDAKTARAKGYWQIIAAKCERVDKADPNFGKQFACLDPDTPLSATAKTTAGAAAAAAVDTYNVERDLCALAEDHLKWKQYAITPSKLDHQSRSVVKRKDRDDDVQTDALSDTLMVQSDDAQAEEAFSPHGPDWGTIVHRIMELAVRKQKFDADSLFQFARQAVMETLPEETLTEAQKKMLLKDPEEKDPDVWAEEIALAASQTVKFLSDPKSSMRKLLDGGRCYPELSFILRETDRSSMLYQHLSSHISDADAADKNLDVQGVIDLAIWKDGAWTVVDYKTDRLRKEEKRQDFEHRLREEYTAQIASYAQVLERLGKGKTAHAYLCSIPLGGELVTLHLDGENKKSRAVDGARPVSRLLSGGRFAKEVAEVTGAHDFMLILDGEAEELEDEGKRVTEIHQFRSFAAAVERWMKEQCPGKDCTVDPTHAGNEVLLRRLLKTMHRVLPAEVWENVGIRWGNKQV